MPPPPGHRSGGYPKRKRFSGRRPNVQYVSETILMDLYEKPRSKPGLVCYSVQWDRNGKIVRALYRKPGEAGNEIARPCARNDRPGRGATAELQAKLI